MNCASVSAALSEYWGDVTVEKKFVHDSLFDENPVDLGNKELFGAIKSLEIVANKQIKKLDMFNHKLIDIGADGNEFCNFRPLLVTTFLISHR